MIGENGDTSGKKTKERSPKPGPVNGKYWWCPACQCWLDWDEVTYEEMHDPETGGCGGKVE